MQSLPAHLHRLPHSQRCPSLSLSLSLSSSSSPSPSPSSPFPLPPSLSLPQVTSRYISLSAFPNSTATTTTTTTTTAAAAAAATIAPVLPCGSLNGTTGTVKVRGWLSSYRTLNDNLTFLSVRDGSGEAQAIATTETSQPWKANQTLESLPLESVVEVTGVVNERPQGQVNEASGSGAVELQATSVKLLNPAVDLPFPYHQEQITVGSEALFKHRYLQLRQPNLQSNIRLRSKLSKIVRDYFHSQDFTEIETPTLFKSTPEGAREFLVPTRTKGHFYSLPQSPQQYKQLLMVGGFERYFQLARCYRDEMGRSDRQPEFTQIDLEMAFATPQIIQDLIEGLLKQLWAEKGHTVSLPFPRMKYDDAVALYGTDRPDTRSHEKFTPLIREVTHLFGNATNATIKAKVADGEELHAICFPAFGSLYLSSAMEKELFLELQRNGVVPHEEEGVHAHIFNFKKNKPRRGLLTETEMESLKELMGCEKGDAVYLTCGKRYEALKALGSIRTKTIEKLQESGDIDLRGQFNFLWVVDFPLFSPPEFEEELPGESPKKSTPKDKNAPPPLVSEHHPFTAPRDRDLPKMFTNPEDVIAQHYDVVVNGMEIGGGSIRVHDPFLQEYILKNILRLPEERLQTFSHLLQALSHGAPPHGGIALGFDRLVSILAEAESLREVIAFPKTVRGRELMTGSPSPATEEQLEEYGLQVRASVGDADTAEEE